MKKLYKTDRLTLKTLSVDNALEVLHFYERNKKYFEPYESKRTDSYYTEEYQRDTLLTESLLFNDNLFLRYYVYLESYNYPIGTISFKKTFDHNSNVMVLGYRFDNLFWGHGYAGESISYLINHIFLENIADKLEALVHPSNHRSIQLLHSLGFVHNPGMLKIQEISSGPCKHQIFTLKSR